MRSNESEGAKEKKFQKKFQIHRIDWLQNQDKLDQLRTPSKNQKIKKRRKHDCRGQKTVEIKCRNFLHSIKDKKVTKTIRRLDIWLIVLVTFLSFIECKNF
jgi:hypothetical protein